MRSTRTTIGITRRWTMGAGALALLLHLPVSGCASGPRAGVAQPGAGRVAPALQSVAPTLQSVAPALKRVARMAIRGGRALASGLVRETPRVARASARAAVTAGREVWSWGPPAAEGLVTAARQVRRLRPRIDRVAAAPPGQDFFVGRTGVRVRHDLESFRDQRFRYVVPQQLDFSCGAAALATLFQYYYDDPVGEGEIIAEMLSRGDADRIRSEGFSLLDMKRFAQSRGYETKGFRLEAGVLERLAIPTVALVETRGYAHFVVLKGARAGDVYLADPAFGQRRVPVEEFEQEWTGVVLFVAKKRIDDVVAPLEVLALNRPSPVEMVRDFDLLGIRPRIATPREF